MASHVPVVSTQVGMAPDLITDGVSGALVEVGDVEAIVDRAKEMVARPDRDGLIASARQSVLRADWSVVAHRHLEEVWRPLLSSR
jgi:glycosyltransferase involved in cell wall biosynthesis